MRLIDADKFWKDTTTNIEECADILEIIERQPTIEAEPNSCEYWDSESCFCALRRPQAEPVKHGHWEYRRIENGEPHRRRKGGAAMKLSDTIPIEVRAEVAEILQSETEAWMMFLIGPNTKRLTAVSVIQKDCIFAEVAVAIDDMSGKLKRGAFQHIEELRK